MKIISSLTLMAVAAAAFITPNKVDARNNDKAILGGIIGGIIIGAAIADDDCDTRVNVSYHNSGHYDNHGYWKWVSVKTWVPGYYERSCDRYGRTRKVWISGYHTYTKQKIWVETGHAGPPSNNRHYDNYRRDDHRDNYRNDHRGQNVGRF